MKLKVKAYKAFLEIYEKLLASPYQLDHNFLDQVLYNYAPLGYIETHYNLYHEIRQYTLASAQLHVFNEDLCIKSDYEPGTDFPLPTTFTGDVHIKGNLEIAFDNDVFITGNLIVDRVITCESDVLLVVGGTIKAKGLETDSTLLDFSICAEKVEVSDVLHMQGFIYSGKIESRLILAKEGFRQYQGRFFPNPNEPIVVVANCQYFFPIPVKDIAAIRALFQPVVFRNADRDLDEWDLLFHIFYALEEKILIYGEDGEYVYLSNIFRE